MLQIQDTITERRKSELDPLGIHLYGFNLFPKIGWMSEYKDNIFETENNLMSDYIAHLTPGFALKSDWNRHSVNLIVDSDVAFFEQNDKEDYQDLQLRLTGRLDVLRRSTLKGGLFFSKNHVDRGSPDDSSAITPTEFFVNGFNLAYKHQFNRFSTQLGMIAQHVDYTNNVNALGATINEQDRNNWHYLPKLRLGYEIQRQYEAFVELGYSRLIYDDRFDDAGFERSSHGYEGVLGLAFDLTGLLTGEAAIGYKQRSVDDSNLSNISGMTGRLNLEWNPTPLTTVRAVFLNTINETTQIGSSGVDNYLIKLEAEHELLRTLILRLNTSYFIRQYTDFDRTQDTEERKEKGGSLGAGIRYLINRYLTADLSYQFRKRNVNRDGEDYDINQVFFHIVSHF